MPSRSLEGAVVADGFAFAPGAVVRAELASVGSLDDWDAFAASWDDLDVDEHEAAHGRSRRRRHAVFAIDEGAIRREPDQPHRQAIEHNVLYGGVDRWFSPIRGPIADGSSLRTILRHGADFFARAFAIPRAFRVEAHQFRIEARASSPGSPTPEGVHRDGVDYVLVLLVRRTNVRSGTTTIHAPDGRLLGSFTLTEVLDTALVDDERVLHGVTAVEPIDPAAPAHRDVLVVTYRRARA